MRGKVIIKTDIKVLTGLHIGGSDAFSSIGAIDSPVVKDPRTGMPIVPGSSLKGKLRTLLAKSLNEAGESVPEDAFRDRPEVARLFGSPDHLSRLQFADAFVCNADEFGGATDMTEAKFENTLNRVTCRANPRQIERVVRGVKFRAVIAYDPAENEWEEDLRRLALAMKYLQLDYLGGHGTRGSGRVAFENFRFECYDCDIAPEKLREIFGEVERYDLLAV